MVILRCSCGYSCGSESALQRHFSRFDSPSADTELQQSSSSLQSCRASSSSVTAAQLEDQVEHRRLSIEETIAHDRKDAAEERMRARTSTGSPTRSPFQSFDSESRPRTATRAVTLSASSAKSAATRAVASSAVSLESIPISGCGHATASTARAKGGGGCAATSDDDDLSGGYTNFTRSAARRATTGSDFRRPSTGAGYERADDVPVARCSPSLTSASRGRDLGGGSAAADCPVRLLLVRHARSENRGRGDAPAVPDPGLPELGMKQALAVGVRLADELGAQPVGSVALVSSPARRCLLTLWPALERLRPRLPRGACICHGGCYEFRGAGTDFRGTPSTDITREFPDFDRVGFAADGCWDYRGSNVKETESELKARIARFVDWLCKDACGKLRRQAAQHGVHDGDSFNANPTLVLATHQSFGDLLCQLLIDRTDAAWEYGAPRYRLQNTAITEITVYPDLRCEFGVQNSDAHLWDCC